MVILEVVHCADEGDAGAGDTLHAKSVVVVAVVSGYNVIDRP